MDKRIRTFEEYQEAYKTSVENPEAFWSDIAENYDWHKKWDNVLSWDFNKPEIKWFEGAQLNMTENCLDHHLESKGDQPAIIWEPNEPTDEAITLTYRQLYEKVCQF